MVHGYTRKFSVNFLNSGYLFALIILRDIKINFIFRSVSDRFGVGKATCFRALRRVICALFQIAHEFIKWPTGQKAIEVMNEFHNVSGLRGVIGAIDGTLIEIGKPTENCDDYICRKGYSAIHLQVN